MFNIINIQFYILDGGATSIYFLSLCPQEDFWMPVPQECKKSTWCQYFPGNSKLAKIFRRNSSRVLSCSLCFHSLGIWWDSPKHKSWVSHGEMKTMKPLGEKDAIFILTLGCIFHNKLPMRSKSFSRISQMHCLAQISRKGSPCSRMCGQNRQYIAEWRAVSERRIITLLPIYPNNTDSNNTG